MTGEAVRAVRRLTAALAIVLAAIFCPVPTPAAEDSSAGPVRLTAVAGIERFERLDTGVVRVFARRGICRFRIAVGPGGGARMRFLYETGRPFPKIEGFHVFDNKAGGTLEADDLLARGSIRRHNGEIRFAAPGSGIDWTVQVIDFYR